MEDLESTLAMGIIDGHFWAMTSEVTEHLPEEEPVSVYRGMRCKLGGREHNPQYFQFFRRDHSDGPVHDLWSKLRMCKSETNEHVILETRREWLADNLGDCTRSFYTLSFDPHSPLSITTSEGFEDTLTHRRRPVLQQADDEFVECDAKIHTHREPLSSVPWISLAQSLYASYEPISRTSIDIIKLRRYAPDVRLRIGHEGQPVRTWPGEDLLDQHKAMGQLFRPGASPRQFRAASDERSLVFGACDGPAAPVVLVCFDPTIDFVQARKKAREGCAKAPEGASKAASWMNGTIWTRGLPALLQQRAARHTGMEDGEG